METDQDVNRIFLCLRPLFLMLRMVGFKIQMNYEAPTFHIILTRIFLLLISIFYVYKHIFITFDGMQLADLWVFVYDDNMVLMSFLYVLWAKERKIIDFTKLLFRTLLKTKNDEKMFSQIKRKAQMLAIINVVIALSMLIATPSLAIFVSSLNEADYKVVSGGIYPQTYSEKITTIVAVQCCLISCFFSADLYVSFVVLLLHIFHACFQSVNQSVQLVEVEQFSHIQKNHRKITLLMEKFNELFSPAILMVVCVRIGQIAACIVNLKDVFNGWKSSADPNGLAAPYIYSVFAFSKAAITFWMLIHAAHKVHQSGKEIFGNLLTKYLSNMNNFNRETRLIVKDCYLSTLITSTWLTAPPTITASDYFSVDYHLIIVVISLVATYFAFIADVKQMNN